MKKRFLSLLMVFCMLITCVPTVGAVTLDIPVSGSQHPHVKNAYTFYEVDETAPIEENDNGDQEIIFYDEETQEVYLKDLPSGEEITALFWDDDDPVPISCTASGNTIKIKCTEMPDDAIAKQGAEGYSSELYVTTSDNCVSMLSVRFMDQKASGSTKFESAYTFYDFDGNDWNEIPENKDWQEITFTAVGQTATVRMQDGKNVVSLTNATFEWDDNTDPIKWTVDTQNNTITIECTSMQDANGYSSELYVTTDDGEESLLSIRFGNATGGGNTGSPASKFLYTEDLDDNEGEDDDEVQIPTTGHVELALFYDGVRVANKGDLDYDDDLLTIKQRETQDGNAYFYISFSDIHQDQNVRIYHEDDTDREYPITFEPVLPKAAFYTEVDTTKDEPEIANIIEHLELIDKKEATVYCCVENRKNLTVDIDWDADETDAGFGVSTLNTDPVEFGGDDGDDYLMYTCKITVTATDDAKGKLDAETSNDAIGELNVRYYVSPEGLSYRDVEIDEDTGVCTVEGPFRKDFEVQFGEWKQAALYLNGVLVDDPTTLTAEDISIWQELITEDENGNAMSWPGLYELRQKEKTDGIIKHTGGKELAVEVGLPDNGFYTSTNFNMDSLVNEFLGDKDFFVTYGEMQTLYYYQLNESYEDDLEFVAMERGGDTKVPTITINSNAVDSNGDGEIEYYKLGISGFTDYFELKAREKRGNDSVSIAVNVKYDGFAYSNTHRVNYPIGKGIVEVASNAHVGLNFYYDGQLVTDASELKFSDGLSYEMLTWEQGEMKGKDYFWIEFTDINSTAPQTVTYVPTGETITLQPVLPLGALYSSSTPSIETLIEDFELVDDTVTAYDKTITVYFFAQEDAWFADSFNRNRIVFKNGLQNDLDIAVSNVGAGTSADGIAGNLYELTLTVLSPNDITRDGFTDKVDAVIDLIDDNGDTEEFCIATCFMTHWYMKEGLTYRELFDGEPGRAYFEKYFKDTNGAVVRELEIGETLDCALYFDGELVTDSSKLSGTNATVTAVDAANGIYTVSPTANNGRISYIENGRVVDYLEIGPQVPTSNNNNNSSNDSSSSTSKPPVDTSKDTTTATPDATVKGDSASASVSNSVGKELIEQANKNDSSEVVIAPEIKGDVNKTEVKIPSNTVGNIGQETDADLTISTPVADVTLPNDGLGQLAAEGGSVEVKAERDGNTVKIEVVAGKETMEKVGSGMTVTVPMDNATSGTVAVIVHADGTREVIPKSVAADGSVTIPLDGSATIELVDNSKDFNDVPADAWSADAVDFVSARGLFSGTGDGNFSPDMPMSRGMIVTVLHNLESNPASTYTGSFADVADGAWYAEGVKWAAENGIATGLPDGSFGANENISREEFAVMLWRYAGSPKAEGTLDFVDAANSSAYAQEALLWAVENGVMSGKAGIYLDPKGEASRAEVAQMLRSFMENI